MRHDRLLRVVMWIDAFLSMAFVAASLLITPVLAAVAPPHAVLATLGYLTMGSAIVLAACGAVTAAAIGARLRAGTYFLPRSLSLPLPKGMRPAPSSFNPP